MELFRYVAVDGIYTRGGRSGLVNANTVLIADVSQLVTVQTNGDLVFNCQECDYLQSYLPYHDIDIERRQPHEASEV